MEKSRCTRKLLTRNVWDAQIPHFNMNKEKEKRAITVPFALIQNSSLLNMLHIAMKCWLYCLHQWQCFFKCEVCSFVIFLICTKQCNKWKLRQYSYLETLNVYGTLNVECKQSVFKRSNVTYPSSSNLNTPLHSVVLYFFYIFVIQTWSPFWLIPRIFHGAVCELKEPLSLLWSIQILLVLRQVKGRPEPELFVRSKLMSAQKLQNVRGCRIQQLKGLWFLR